MIGKQPQGDQMKRKRFNNEELPDFSKLKLSNTDSTTLTLEQINQMLQSNSYLASSTVMEIVNTLQMYYEEKIQQILHEVNSRPMESSYIS